MILYLILLDSDETLLYVGVEWEPVKNISGNFKIGTGDKKFKSDDRENLTATIWEMDVRWALKEDSVINIKSMRQFDETKGSGNAQININYEVVWRYDWNGKLNSLVGATFYDDQFNDSDRADYTYALRFQLSYRFIRWINTYASFAVRDRSSTFSNYQLNQNLITLGVEATL